MVSKEMVGTRIRSVRTGQRKTLKDVEAASGFSSTHISEIERGRTSPTIGALIRIAHALDKDPSFFIEERELEETCVTTREERPASVIGIDFVGEGIHVDSLTRGVLGGRLLMYEVHVEPEAKAAIDRLPETGDMCIYCLAGRCDFLLEGQWSPFGQEDSLHVAIEEGKIPIRGAADQDARLLIVVDPREAIS